VSFFISATMCVPLYSSISVRSSAHRKMFVSLFMLALFMLSLRKSANVCALLYVRKSVFTSLYQQLGVFLYISKCVSFFLSATVCVPVYISNCMCPSVYQQLRSLLYIINCVCLSVYQHQCSSFCV